MISFHHPAPLRLARPLLLAGLLALLCACQRGDSSADTLPEGYHSVKATRFLSSLMQSARMNQHAAPVRFSVPSLWLYSPEGELVRQFNDAQSLRHLPESMSAPPENRPANLPLALLTSTIAGSSGKSLELAEGSQWHAVVFLSQDDRCTRCAEFASHSGEVLATLQQSGVPLGPVNTNCANLI